MPGGGYTGDGSVKWFVEVDNARDGETKTSPRPGFDKGLKHEGVDETASGRFFKVTIKCPFNGTQWQSFVTRLVNQAQIAKQNLDAQIPAGGPPPPDGQHGVLTLFVPIEDEGSGYSPPSNPVESDYQVLVKWPQEPSTVT